MRKQYNAYAGLIQKNQDVPFEAADAVSGEKGSNPLALPLPFILFQVARDANVEISISEDHRQAQFDFKK